MKVRSNQRQTLPAPETLSRNNFELLLRRIADDIAFGTDESLFVGSGLEYAQSRPYEPGDPVRQIDWKVSARMPVAYVKQHETLKRLAMYLLVDTSASMQVSSSELSKHSLAIWLAGALGLVALRRLSPVSVQSGGSRFKELRGELLPSLSPDALWRNLEPLRRCDFQESTEMKNQLDSLALKVRERSLMVVLSDLHDDEMVDSLRKLGPQHDVIVIHLMDPVELGKLNAGYFMGQESESGAQMMVRGSDQWRHHVGVERQLAGADVSYLRLRTDQSPVMPLREFLLTRVSLMRGQR